MQSSPDRFLLVEVAYLTLPLPHMRDGLMPKRLQSVCSSGVAPVSRRLSATSGARGVVVVAAHVGLLHVVTLHASAASSGEGSAASAGGGSSSSCGSRCWWAWRCRSPTCPSTAYHKVLHAPLLKPHPHHHSTTLTAARVTALVSSSNTWTPFTAARTMGGGGRGNCWEVWRSVPNTRGGANNSFRRRLLVFSRTRQARTRCTSCST